jgi:transposase
VTGLGWEGSGVLPVIEVPVSEALTWAYVEDLEHLTENTISRCPNVIAEREWALGELKAKLNDQHSTIEELDKYTGTYDTRQIWVENGFLQYQRDNKSDKLKINICMITGSCLIPVICTMYEYSSKQTIPEM